ncbi:response regulator [Iningainema tapete]|uniref:Protein PatA n=1 Tax=Iningainema tapete BLCC-T55 TaxID=2748662 RepID=A0A8J7BYP9_9CYAN|nr:response regulator [Iningainema tapete]MBD2774438.1 response regulator [Iningainema tapete BLCC-T55]
MSNFGTFTKLRPPSLLRYLSNCFESTILQVSSNSVSWFIYLEQGKIIYATHSVEPFDRLERHLRRLNHQIPNLTSDSRVQLRLMFEPDSHESESVSLPFEYQAICWLISQRYLQSKQAGLLIQELVKEVIESFLLIKQGTYELKNFSDKLPTICRLDVEKITERCQERLRGWQSLGAKISSPYQRPYLWIQNSVKPQNLPEINQNLTYWMKGFSLRHLAVIMNQDEIQLARNLYPYILDGAVLLHQPDPPFDKLPKTSEETLQNDSNPIGFNSVLSPSNIYQKAQPVTPVEEKIPIEQQPIISENKNTSQELTTSNNKNLEPPKVPLATNQKIYKIVSVDDSPTILREISRFLEDENFSVVTINDPLKAVMSIIRHKPDLILLDLNMDGIDGYELCRIIRNNSMFKNTPIIMVTGNKGIVDKVKARLVGSSGYLTKPFSRADLLKMVFMHLV